MDRQTLGWLWCRTGQEATAAGLAPLPRVSVASGVRQGGQQQEPPGEAREDMSHTLQVHGYGLLSMLPTQQQPTCSPCV